MYGTGVACKVTGGLGDPAAPSTQNVYVPAGRDDVSAVPDVQGWLPLPHGISLPVAEVCQCSLDPTGKWTCVLVFGVYSRR